MEICMSGSRGERQINKSHLADVGAINSDAGCELENYDTLEQIH